MVVISSLGQSRSPAGHGARVHRAEFGGPLRPRDHRRRRHTLYLSEHLSSLGVSPSSRLVASGRGRDFRRHGVDRQIFSDPSARNTSFDRFLVPSHRRQLLSLPYQTESEQTNLQAAPICSAYLRFIWACFATDSSRLFFSRV